MAITRQLSNGQKLTDWTSEVNDIANQYGLLNGSGLFGGSGTSQLSVVFDKTTNEIRLLDQRTRAGQGPSRNNDRRVETFSLALPYFLHADYVTPQDIQGHRMPGTPDSAESLAHVIATKLEDMRYAVDQTREYMKIQAIKGLTLDGGGTAIADMFDLFDLTAASADYEIDFALGTTAGYTIDLAIANLKRTVSKNAKTGGRMGKIEVMVTPEFFDALVTNPQIREAYLHYQVRNNRSDAVRGDMARFEDWGVVDTFEHKGVLFYSYDAEFNRDNGDGSTSIVRGLGALNSEEANSRDSIWSSDPGSDELRRQQGYAVIRGSRDMYKGVWGPSNTLSGANSVGAEMTLLQYTDPKDKFHEMELEMSNLYYMTRPQSSIKVYSST